MAVTQVYKHTLLGGMVLALVACANGPGQDQTEQSVNQSTGTQVPVSRVDTLSKGKSVTIETSQGSLDVAPTVVSVGDEQQNDPSGDIVYNDPWESVNRAIFSFNHFTYQYALLPLSDGYRYVVPGGVRDKIGNAFDNLREPLNLLNNTFSGELDEAGTNLGRFLINSTVGLLGLFDPATDWFDIAPQKQTIANTLQHYDINAGPYLVLPILGPSDSRGAFSTLTEGVIHPVNYVADPPETYQLRIVDGVDDFSSQSDVYRSLYEQADDPYIYFRNQYIQGQRRDELFELSEQEQE
ncbi:VacJ family lipoprotein [Alteromonas sp. C1M14]|uniref:MlaA family lipoprotein n=1 Tax=Alteromonas sp. C1M14 TaxID=2841567 RepID=UPI001C08A9CB|nr:VacJ family lipoprotein [Alteromonas sp. C1M14]MBU2977182.1 VacJ family lipoprotein [Alteromonas sp. C1M14]